MRTTGESEDRLRLAFGSRDVGLVDRGRRRLDLRGFELRLQ